MLDLFFEKNTFYLSPNGIELALVAAAPARRDGELRDPHRRQGHRRGRAPHHRAPRPPAGGRGVDRLPVPTEYLVGKVLAHDVVNTETGEILAKANEILTAVTAAKLVQAGSGEIRVLYVNDLDRGPFISDTLRIDPTKNRMEALVEIYRMDAPGEPPTRDAAENLFQNLFFQPRALRPLRRRPHEVQPPRGAHRKSRARASSTTCCTFTRRGDGLRPGADRGARRHVRHHRRAAPR